MNRSIMFTQWCITVHIGKFDRWYSGPAVYVCTLIVQPPAQQLRKKKKFRSSRFKKSGRKKKPNKNKKQLVVTCDVWPCAACAGVKITGAVITHGHVECTHEKEKEKKSHVHVQCRGCRLKTVFLFLTLLTVPVQVQLISFYTAPPHPPKKKKRFHLDHCCTNDIRCLAVVYTAHQKKWCFPSPQFGDWWILSRSARLDFWTNALCFKSSVASAD